MKKRQNRIACSNLAAFVVNRINPTLGLFSIFGISLMCSACTSSKIGSDFIAINKSMEEQKQHDWNVDIVEQNFRNGALAVFFLDLQFGWVGSGNSIFETSDSGKTWQPTEISASSDEFVTKIYFQDESNGWIVVKKHEKINSNFTDREFRILRTNDSGKTWQQLFSESDGDFTSWKFDSHNQLWIAGLKYRTSSPICFDPLLLTYDTKTAKTVDVAKTIFEGKKKNTVGCLNDVVMGIDIDENGIVNIITGNLEVYQENNDSSWGIVHRFGDQFVKTGVNAFGVSYGSAWFVGGTDGEEGTYGRLSFVSKTNQIEENTKNGSFFEDAIRVSDSEFLISGFIVEVVVGKQLAGRNRSKHGAIFGTVDGGKSFDEIYRAQIDSEISSMFQLDNYTIWAICKNGILIRLTRIDR
jgi:hypothetical protein